MSMLDATSTDKEREDNFVIACGTHDKNMHECTEGRGCDRHLFGLKILAALNGFEEPELFKDPAWKMSGGDGNFILSTSFIGYSDIFGGVAPMVKEGYGCFYKMNNDKITIFMSSYRSCPETSAFKLEESVRWALNSLRPYLHAYSLRSHPKKYATKRSKL